jgi:hypothetical protein
VDEWPQHAGVSELSAQLLLEDDGAYGRDLGPVKPDIPLAAQGMLERGR